MPKPGVLTYQDKKTMQEALAMCQNILKDYSISYIGLPPDAQGRLMGILYTSELLTSAQRSLSGLAAEKCPDSKNST